MNGITDIRERMKLLKVHWIGDKVVIKIRFGYMDIHCHFVMIQ